MHTKDIRITVEDYLKSQLGASRRTRIPRYIGTQLQQYLEDENRFDEDSDIVKFIIVEDPVIGDPLGSEVWLWNKEDYSKSRELMKKREVYDSARADILEMQDIERKKFFSVLTAKGIPSNMHGQLWTMATTQGMNILFTALGIDASAFGDIDSMLKEKKSAPDKLYTIHQENRKK